MYTDVIECEKEIVILEKKIDELKTKFNPDSVDIGDEIEKLEIKLHKLIEKKFSKLSPMDILQLARHPNRPHTTDYLGRVFDDFMELHGDRWHHEGRAIIGGIAQFEGQSVMVIGQEKGRELKDKIERNFAMPSPADYLKALRLMKLAERFRLPIITFIDTPGAYPGIEAERNNQSFAIAQNIRAMSELEVPVISIIIGEGGSGGALAIGVCDQLMMLKYSVYSVISPEGCASILWKTPTKVAEAASAMKMTSGDLQALGLIDQIIEEPIRGAHCDLAHTVENIKASIQTALTSLQAQPIKDLLAKRYDKLMMTASS